MVISGLGQQAMATRLIQIATGDKNATVAGFTSRVGQGDPRKQAVAKWCADNTVDHVVKTLLEAGNPGRAGQDHPPASRSTRICGSARCWVKMPDAVAGEVFVPGATIKMSKTPGRVGHVPVPRRAHRRGAVGDPRLRQGDARRAQGREGDRLNLLVIARSAKAT